MSECSVSVSPIIYPSTSGESFAAKRNLLSNLKHVTLATLSHEGKTGKELEKLQELFMK